MVQMVQCTRCTQLGGPHLTDPAACTMRPPVPPLAACVPPPPYTACPAASLNSSDPLLFCSCRATQLPSLPSILSPHCPPAAILPSSISQLPAATHGALTASPHSAHTSTLHFSSVQLQFHFHCVSVHEPRHTVRMWIDITKMRHPLPFTSIQRRCQTTPDSYVLQQCGKTTLSHALTRTIH